MDNHVRKARCTLIVRQITRAGRAIPISGMAYSHTGGGGEGTIASLGSAELYSTGMVSPGDQGQGRCAGTPT